MHILIIKFAEIKAQTPHLLIINSYDLLNVTFMV